VTGVKIEQNKQTNKCDANRILLGITEPDSEYSYLIEKTLYSNISMLIREILGKFSTLSYL